MTTDTCRHKHRTWQHMTTSATRQCRIRLQIWHRRCWERVNGWLNGWGTQIPGHPLASQQLRSIASHQTDQQGTYIAPAASRKLFSYFRAFSLLTNQVQFFPRSCSSRKRDIRSTVSTSHACCCLSVQSHVFNVHSRSRVYNYSIAAAAASYLSGPAFLLVQLGPGEAGSLASTKKNLSCHSRKETKIKSINLLLPLWANKLPVTTFLCQSSMLQSLCEKGLVAGLWGTTFTIAKLTRVFFGLFHPNPEKP